RRKPKALFIAVFAAPAMAVGTVWIWAERERSNTDLHLQTTIQTEPADALVMLDDHVFQKTPATFTDLEPRKYRLQIKHPGYEPVETVVDLRRGKSLELPPFRLVRSNGGI